MARIEGVTQRAERTAARNRTGRQGVRPLRCWSCDARRADLHIPGAGDHRRVRGVRRLATWIRCKVCGHEWKSVHPDAVEAGREADARAEEKQGRRTRRRGAAA